MKYLAAYVTALVVFFAVDMAWLATMTKRFYRPVLGDIMASGVNIVPAVVFYGLYPAGLVIFAVAPALKDSSLSTALLYGALFGFFTYATYDLTNHATLRNWTTQLTLVDVIWGTVLASIAATASYWLVQKFA